MAVILAKLKGDFPIRCNRPEAEIWILSFETNGTGDPDGLDPAFATGVTLDRTGAGDYTVTFDEAIKPNKVLACLPSYVEGLPKNDVKYVSYTASTGVLVLMATEEDGTSGISAEADTTDKTISLVLFVSKSDKS
jgi:hypothetical protein